MDLDDLIDPSYLSSYGNLSQDELSNTLAQADSVFNGNPYHNESLGIFYQDDFALAGVLQQTELSRTSNQDNSVFVGGLYQDEFPVIFDQNNSIFAGVLPENEFYDILNPHELAFSSVSQQNEDHGIFNQVHPTETNSTSGFHNVLSQRDSDATLTLGESSKVKRGSGSKSGGKRSSTSKISEEQWEDRKDTIERIWMKEKHTMDELRYEMAQIHHFSASKKLYRKHFGRWEFHKNNKKQNRGVNILRENDDEGLPRRRVAQALPKKRKAVGLLYVSASVSVPKTLAHEALKHQEKMFHALDTIVKGLFGAGKKGWTFDEFSIIPPAGTADKSKAWQLLTDQCYSTATLAETRLYSRVSSSLLRVLQGLEKAAKRCEPSVLVHFWKICLTINSIRLSGKLKQEKFPLLRVFLKILEKAFSRSLGSHAIIDFLRSLNHVLADEPQNFRTTLGQSYKRAIDSLGDIIGRDHVIVLKMLSHYTKHWKTKFDLQVHWTSFSERYESLLKNAEESYGASGEQTISLLYDYAYAISEGKPNPNLLEKLHSRSAELCQGQTALKCTLTTRAFAFSTESFANMCYAKERSRSFEYMDKAIEVLGNGDQECRIWAAAFSKRLVRWYKTDGNREALAKERDRMIAIRSQIDETQTVVPASRRSLGKVTGTPFKRIRAQRRTAQETVVSSALGSLEL